MSLICMFSGLCYHLVVSLEETLSSAKFFSFCFVLSKTEAPRALLFCTSLSIGDSCATGVWRECCSGGRGVRFLELELELRGLRYLLWVLWV